MTSRTHGYRYRLTEEAEDDLLKKKEQRKMLADKALCAQYSISRSTLRQALQRARARRAPVLPEQDSNGG
jgi:DNA-binding FadR family transcriptional regulator